MTETKRRGGHQATFTVLVISVMTFALLQSLITPVIAEIQSDLHTTQTTVTWALTAYFLSASVFTPIVGRIGDKIGKDRMLVVMLVVLSVGSVVAALATSIGPLIVARAIQGAGGGVLPLSFGIIRDEMPSAKIPGAVGIVSSLAAVGGGVGIVLAGPIVDLLDYHWLFWIPAIITAITAVAAHRLVPRSPVRTTGRIGVLPAALLSSWLVCLLLALSEGGDWGWDSRRIMGLLGSAVAIAVLWVLVEERSSSPLIDMKMMRLPAVWIANVVALLVGFGIYTFIGFAPQFTQTAPSSGYGFGASITQSGLLQMPTTLMMFAVSLLSGTFVTMIGPKAVVVIGNLVSALGLTMLALVHDHVWQVCVANAVLGAGTGLVMACLANLVMGAVRPDQTGAASGMNANIRWIGGSIGGAVMASVVTAATLPDGRPQESGYTDGFLVLAAAYAVAAGIALLIPAVSRSGADGHFIAEPEIGLVPPRSLVGEA